MQSYGSKIFIIFISVVQKHVVSRCWYKFHFHLYFVFVFVWFRPSKKYYANHLQTMQQQWNQKAWIWDISFWKLCFRGFLYLINYLFIHFWYDSFLSLFVWECFRTNMVFSQWLSQVLFFIFLSGLESSVIWCKNGFCNELFHVGKSSNEVVSFQVIVIFPSNLNFLFMLVC